LAVDKTVECLSVGVVFLEGLLVGFDGEGFVLLGFVTLSANEAFAAFHFVVNEGVIEVEFQNCETLFILFVKVKGLGSQELETDVMTEEFSALEEGMNLFKIIVPEIAFTHEVDTANMAVRESQEFITIKDGI
jgi:hypothetical protein